MNQSRNKTWPLLLVIGTVLSTILILTSCRPAGPDYAEPDLGMPNQYTGQTNERASTEADDLALAKSWNLFGDPTLTDLIERAIAGNLDLQQAEGRVLEVRGQRRATKGTFLPTAVTTGSGSATRNQELLVGDTTESYRTALDVSWEPDFFGRKRRTLEADQANFEAARETFRDVLVSLTAETATAYVNLRTFQKQRQTAEENLRLQAETLELVRIKFKTGLAGSLDVDQATYNLESTRSQIPDLETNITQAKNRLAVLLGDWPGDLDKMLNTPSAIPKGPLKPALGIPADLLRRRPDVREAERRLAAQTALIGVAEADLYPQFSGDTSLSWNSLALRGLISPVNFTAVFGGSITWKIFNLESVRANIDIQNARQEQALLAYEAVVRTAVEEVENAMVALAMETKKQASLEKAVRAAREASRLARQGYENGLTDFQRVLDTQQSYLSFQTSLDQSYGRSALDLIVIYKAMGGGWAQFGK